MTGSVYQFGFFRVDPDAHTLSREGVRITIQEQPFQVLLGLLERPGEIVTRETLRMRLWGTSTFVDFDQSLNSAVRRLRLALNDNSRVPVYIETIPRVGFRFLPGVEVGAPPFVTEATATGSAPQRGARQAPAFGAMTFSVGSC